jgi:hypothetical protein
MMTDSLMNWNYDEENGHEKAEEARVGKKTKDCSSEDDSDGTGADDDTDVGNNSHQKTQSTVCQGTRKRSVGMSSMGQYDLNEIARFSSIYCSPTFCQQFPLLFTLFLQHFECSSEEIKPVGPAIHVAFDIWLSGQVAWNLINGPQCKTRRNQYLHTSVMPSNILYKLVMVASNTANVDFFRMGTDLLKNRQQRLQCHGLDHVTGRSGKSRITLSTGPA